MDTRTLESLQSGLAVLLSFALGIAFLMFIFVFIINWEDCFFGIRLAGPFAGAYLFAKAAGAFILLFLLVQYPGHRLAWASAAGAYFGFLFSDSSVTIRQNTGGQMSFSIFMALFLVVPVLLFIVTLPERKKATGPMDPQNTGGITAPAKTGAAGKQVIHPFLLLLCGIIGLMIVYILVIPTCMALFHTMGSSGTLPGTVQPHPAIISKVSPNGTTEFQVAMKPCNIVPVGALDGSDTGYLIFGASDTFTGQLSRPLLVVLDRNGSQAWTWSPEPVAGEASAAPAIHNVFPDGDGYHVILKTKREVVLDTSGIIIGEKDSSENVDQDVSFGLLSQRFSATSLPARDVSVLVWTDEGERGTLFGLEDVAGHRTIVSVDAVRPTADGGYLVMVSVTP